MPRNRLKDRRSRQRQQQQQQEVRRQERKQRLAHERQQQEVRLQQRLAHERQQQEVRLQQLLALPSGLRVDRELCFCSPFKVMISEITLVQVLKEYLQIHDFCWKGYYSVAVGHPIYNFLPMHKLTDQVVDCISAWSVPGFTKILENSDPEVLSLSSSEVIANQWSSFLCSFAANMRKFHEMRTGRLIQYFPLPDFDINYEDALFVMSKTDDDPRSCFEGIDQDFYWFPVNERDFVLR